MDHLQVVLSLKEGKGFDKITNPTTILATLNGLSLETDLISPESNPLFATDLVWEANKSTLRKMRSSQEPLKLESYEFKENGVKDKIGFVLLSLRSAPIIPRGSDDIIKTNWYKLLSLRSDVKSDKPEILLSLTIEDRQSPEIGSLESKNEQLEKIHNEMELPVPYVIPEEQLIQLGSVITCRDIFLLNIVAGVAANLHFLITQNIAKCFTFWYKILDNELQSKPFAMEMNTYPLNEKIVMRIRTSFSMLQNYLEKKSSISIILKHGGNVMGESEVDMRPLLLGGSLEEWLNKYKDNEVQLKKRCFLKTIDRRDDLINIEDKPFLDLQLILKYIGNSPNCVSNDTEILELMMKQKTGITTHQRPLDDSYPKCLRSVHGSDYTTITKMNHFSTIEIPKERPGNAITHSCIEQDCTNSVEPYHCYCLSVTLNAVTLRTESIKNIEFTFHHPKAEVMSTLYPRLPVRMGETLQLHDIGCKLHFISAAEKIKHLLLTYPPKISIRNEERLEKSCLGQTTLDVTRIFNEGTLECSYEAPLLNFSHHEVGSLHIHMHLEDLSLSLPHGPYYSSTKISWSDNLGPPVLDDSLAYKIVDELETWKERQQEMFRVELKRKEERHLNLLSEEWQRRREALECQLASSIDQCKMLTTNLNKATDDLRTRRVQSMEKETKLLKANEELQWNYEKKLRELKDTSEKMQEDYFAKLLKLEEENKSSQDQLSNFKTENGRLQKIILEQNQELVKYQKGSLTSDQMENLLQEMKQLEQKLNHTVKSNIFFKEQWGKAVREIHKLKMDHQQALEVQIKSSREELKNIDLEQLLQVDSVALKSDKMLLDEIQQEINVIKPKPSFTNIEGSIFHDAYESCCRSNVDFSMPHFGKSNEQDERLRKLIEERDILLKTGSYSIDDAIIIRLNTEIRSLLMAN